MITPADQAMVEITARLVGYPMKALRGRQRHQSLANARLTAYWLLRKTTKLSLPEIGQVFGGRDHTTIIHGCRAIEKRYRNGSFWSLNKLLIDLQAHDQYFEEDGYVGTMA